MAYQIFEKRHARMTTPAVTIATNGRIILNSAAARIFHKNAVENVLLLFDAEQNKMALRSISKKDSRAYKVTFGRNQNGCSFSGKSFLDWAKMDYREKHTFPAVWNEEEVLLEISLASEVTKGDRQRKLLPVEANRRHTRVG